MNPNEDYKEPKEQKASPKVKMLELIKSSEQGYTDKELFAILRISSGHVRTLRRELVLAGLVVASGRRSGETVWKIMKYEPPPRKLGRPGMDKDYVVRLVNKGVSAADIAQLVGAQVSSVRVLIKKLGLAAHTTVPQERLADNLISTLRAAEHLSDKIVPEVLTSDKRGELLSTMRDLKTAINRINDTTWREPNDQRS